MEKNAGIYKILNVKSGNFYIGSTIHFDRRFKDHKRALKKGTHPNYKLQSDFDTFGDKIFKYEIIEKVENFDILISKEQYYLDIWKPYYNIQVLAGNRYGQKLSDETKAKMSKAKRDLYIRIGKLKEKQPSPLHIIYKFTFPGNKVYIGQTVDFKTRIANHKKKAKEGKIQTPLYNAINKYGWESITIEKLIYCFPEDVDELERLYISHFKTTDREFGYNLDSGGVLNKVHSASTRQKISQANKNKSLHTFRTRVKKIAAYSLDGDLVAVFESASEAARRYGVSANVIARAARGGRKTSCGFVWKYMEDSV